MAFNIPRGRSDDYIEQIRQALATYEAEHPQARIDVYRQNSASIRVRIIDPDFAGSDRADRHDQVWSYLERLDEWTLNQITILLLLTPAETAESFANFEFEHPTPSRL